eukprot:Skav222651  [mRNA]  locus=scaffold997:205789:207644:- [translate_table: standard]
MEEVAGDLLEAPEQYIVQQSNCATTYPAGLAAAIAEKFPHADVYKPEARKRRGTERGDCPGTIAVMGGPCATEEQEKRGVINVFGQFCPGKPNKRTRGRVNYKGIEAGIDVVDDEQQRLEWFKAALQQIAELPDLESVAFPYQIGCGLAGGDWKQYQAALNDFAQQVKDQHVQVKLYKMPEAAKPCTDCKKLAGPGAGRAWKSYWYCTSCYDKY